jgi:tetratricopeptide (TPR) repeat protein
VLFETMIDKDSSARRPARLPQAEKVLAVLVGVGGLLLGAALTADAWDDGKAPYPFAWRDVAVVYFLAALPIAWILARSIRERQSDLAVVALAGLFGAIGLGPFVDSVHGTLSNATYFYPYLPFIVRDVSACALALSALLLMDVIRGSRRYVPRPWLPFAALALFAYLLVPANYVEDRCRQDRGRVAKAWSDGHLVEVRPLVDGLMTLDPQSELNGQALTKVARRIKEASVDLQVKVSQPLANNAAGPERLERARDLARLGRTDSVIELLGTVKEASLAPEVENMLGDIYRVRAEWGLGLASYQRARAEWEPRPASAERVQGLLRAIRGIAYCQRRMGRDAEAESAYHEVLALSPTADSHFLLAEFYSTIKRADKARFHAAQAADLSPAAYQQQAKSLFHTMDSLPFGCSVGAHSILKAGRDD